MTDYFSAGEGEPEQSIASRNGQTLLTGRGRAAGDEGQSREQGWGFGYFDFFLLSPFDFSRRA
jgi:hypothetical protein